MLADAGRRAAGWRSAVRGPTFSGKVAWFVWAASADGVFARLVSESADSYELSAANVSLNLRIHFIRMLFRFLRAPLRFFSQLQNPLSDFSGLDLFFIATRSSICQVKPNSHWLPGGVSVFTHNSCRAGGLKHGILPSLSALKKSLPTEKCFPAARPIWDCRFLLMRAAESLTEQVRWRLIAFDERFSCCSGDFEFYGIYLWAAQSNDSSSGFGRPI